MTAAQILLGAITAERLAELWWAHLNTAELLSKGAKEHSPGHYSTIVILHFLWLASLWVSGWTQPLIAPWLVTFLIVQVLRLWVLTTLGRRWTTRIIVMPGDPLVATGPYQFISHPNYLVVAAEIATLPLCLGVPGIALVFSAANAVVLMIRISAENDALVGAQHVERR